MAADVYPSKSSAQQSEFGNKACNAQIKGKMGTVFHVSFVIFDIYV